MNSLVSSSNHFANSYAIIINKKKVNGNLILTLITPQWGFLDTLYYQNQKSKIPPLFVQPLNLIEAVIKSPNYKQTMPTLTEIDLRYSFQPEIIYVHHWFLITLLNFIKTQFYLNEQKESPTIFMMLLKLLNLSTFIKSPLISEFICFCFFMKTILILKINDLLLRCSQCKKTIFSKEMNMSEFIYYSNEAHGFICDECKKRNNLYFLESIHDNIIFLLKSIIFLPFEELLSETIQKYTTLYYGNLILLLDPFWQSLFSRDWSSLIKVKENPFLET